MIGGNDCFVRFDLGKVWIQSEVENDFRVDPVFDVQARVNFNGFINEASEVEQCRIPGEHSRRDRRDPRAGFGDCQARDDFEGAFGREIIESGEMSGLIEEASAISRDRHPRIGLVIEALDHALEMYAPQHVLPCFVTQRLERNRDLDDVTVFSELAFRLHHDVDAEVFVFSFGVDAVGLDAEGVEEEFVSAALIVESVEEHAHVVVVEDVVTFGECGKHFVGFVVGVETDVEKLGVVTDEDFGWF